MDNTNTITVLRIGTLEVVDNWKWDSHKTCEGWVEDTVQADTWLTLTRGRRIPKKLHLREMRRAPNPSTVVGIVAGSQSNTTRGVINRGKTEPVLDKCSDGLIIVEEMM